ncbi:MAG TPA: hypothetical protein DCP74_07905, partial [Bacteroidales bacterium]|nr:hypothetical protein [Bacteroidales bacterium]
MKTIQTILFLLLSIGVYSQTSKAYITNYGDNFISVVDIQTKQKIADITTGNKPHGVAVSPDGNLIAVSNEGDNTVS